MDRSLPSEAYRCALQALEAENALRAEPRVIARALATLTAVCVRPADFDDAKVVLWSDRLREVLNEYPGEVALAVLVDWPKTEGGKFWATENELRAELDRAMALRKWLRFELDEAMREALAEESYDPNAPEIEWDLKDGLSKRAHGDVLAFCEGWRSRNPERAEAYLKVCRFGENVIATANTIALDMLTRELREHAPGIRAVGAAAIGTDGKVEWAL